MASPLLARSSYACTGCQRTLFRNLVAFAGLQPPPSDLPLRRSASPLRPARRPHAAAPSRSSARHYSERVPRQEQANLPGLAGLEEVGDGAEAVQSAQDQADPVDEDVPWYLREGIYDEPQRDLPGLLADRQRLPDLPDLPPPLLQTLLEHISVDLGLDDLSLLDLRTLDPPSALGANLIMVVGTARSEKHLHVSADRFCRYLRSTHKLRAHADGLLGRGELKVRMRRMAKRSRILANVGAVDTRRADDDIRTGWVCVMVDGMDPHPEWEAPQRRPDFIGFDERSDGISLVVQMFTESKREEIDIEALWTKRIQRATDTMADGSTETSTPTEVMPSNDSSHIVLGNPDHEQSARAAAG